MPRSRRRPLGTSTRRVVATLALVGWLIVPRLAAASEILFSPVPITTDDEGRITATARQKTSSVIPPAGGAGDDAARDAGGEHWVVHLWAELDNAKSAPLTITLLGKLPDGRRYAAFRHVLPEYKGERYIDAELELKAAAGVRPGETYTVELTQFSQGGKLLKIAGTRVTLSGARDERRPPGAAVPPDAGSPPRAALATSTATGGEQQREPSAAASSSTDDASDTNEDAPSDVSSSPASREEAPPPLDGRRRGCQAATGAPPALLIGVLAMLRRRRRSPRLRRSATGAEI